MNSLDELLPKPSHIEALMIRRTMTASRYSDRLVNYSWEKLSNEPGMGRCRLMAETMLALRLYASPESFPRHLHHNSLWWLTQKCDKKMFLAVIFVEAKLSKENWLKIYQEIVAHQYLRMPKAAKLLWESMANGEYHPSWEQIVEAVGLKSYDPMPPVNRPDLYTAIKHLTVNPPREMLAGRLEDLACNEEIVKWPNARKYIVRSAMTLDIDINFLINAIAWRAQFADEIMAAILDPAELKPKFSSKDKEKVVYDRLCTMVAEFVEFGLKKCSDDDRARFLTQIMSANNHPWIWDSIAKVMIYHKINDQWPVFLANYMIAVVKSSQTSRFSEDPLDYIWRRLQVEFKGKIVFLLGHFTAEHLVKLVTILMESSEGQFIYRKYLSRLPELIKKADPANFETNVERLLGEIPLCSIVPELMFDIVSVAGLALVKVDFRHWLDSYKGEISLNDDAAKMIVEAGIPAGKLLYDEVNIRRLFDAGYILKAGDLDEKVVTTILSFDSRHSGGLWENKIWRNVLLTGPFLRRRLVISLLREANTNHPKEALAWANETLLPYIQSPEIIQALCEIAWESEQPEYSWGYSGLARQIRLYQMSVPFEPANELARPIEEKMLPEFRRKNWYSLLFHQRDIFAAFWPGEDLLNLFFVDRLYSPNGCGTSNPADYDKIFVGVASRKRLREHMITKFGAFPSEQWLNWVKHFGFSNEENFPKLIEELADTTDTCISDKALDLLEGK